MNGEFFILDTSVYDSNNPQIPSMEGKYLSHYDNTWVISKEPERNASSFGAVDEWQTLLNLEDGNFFPVPAKTVTATDAEIVDQNVIGPMVDYVAQYKTSSQINFYYRDRNIDSVFSTADYSLKDTLNHLNSILGSYDSGETYIKQFNNSVMLYPNLRMVINGNVVVSYSYTVRPERIGTILVPFGDLQEDFFPNVYFDRDKQYIITKNATGYIRIIRLGTNVPDRIERMAQYIHRINTVDTINILVEREQRITAEYGSLDWNNKFEINNKVTGELNQQQNKTYHVNSAYNPLYEITDLRSASMIISDTTFTLYGTLFNQQTDNGFNLNFINSQLPDGRIDVFFDTVQPSKYKYSIVNNIQRFFTQFEDLPFPPGVFVPFPVGTRWSLHNEVVATGEMSQGLLAVGLTNNNKTLDLYLFTNQIYFGRDSFDLFGIQYVYDGDYIYQGSERIAMAFGYIFMGCDSNQAYFYNPWDKSVYLFTGSRTLSKFINLTSRSLVKLGRYDGFSGEMIFLTQDEILKSREGSIMNFPYIPGDLITPTKKGPYIKLADSRRILLSPKDGITDNFEVVTGFIGIDGSTICDYERIDIRLFSPDKTDFNFTVEIQTINQDTKESEQKQINIKGSDWSIDGYKTIKLIPQYKKGTGLSLRIYCEQDIYISEIEYTYEPVSRTANSQRSGF